MSLFQRASIKASGKPSSRTNGSSSSRYSFRRWETTPPPPFRAMRFRAAASLGRISGFSRSFPSKSRDQAPISRVIVPDGSGSAFFRFSFGLIPNRFGSSATAGPLPHDDGLERRPALVLGHLPWRLSPILWKPPGTRGPSRNLVLGVKPAVRRLDEP